MNRVTMRRAAGLMIAAVVLAGCASSTEFHADWLNPQAASHLPVKNVLVMGITRDTTARHLYEDAMVRQLEERGVKAQASYRFLPAEDNPAAQEVLERTVRQAGADSVLISRTVSVTNEVRVRPSYVMAPPYGFGWPGFYGYYHGMWPVYAIPPDVYTVQNVLVDTRLFDAKDFLVLWSGSSTTVPASSMRQTISDFATTLTAQLAQAKVI